MRQWLHIWLGMDSARVHGWLDGISSNQSNIERVIFASSAATFHRDAVDRLWATASRKVMGHRQP